MAVGIDTANWKAAIKELREPKTQREVAAALGYKDETWVSRFESGGTTTREWLGTKLRELADAYGCAPDDLLRAAGLLPGPQPWHAAFPGLALADVEIPVPLVGTPDGWPRTAPELGAHLNGEGFVWIVGPAGTGRATAAAQLAKAAGAKVLDTEPPEGWAAFRSRTEGGRWVALTQALPGGPARWRQDGQLLDLHVSVAPWRSAEWRALLTRLVGAGRASAARVTAATALCDRLGEDTLPWELGVQALADFLAGDGRIPDDVWGAVLDAAVDRASALLPELRPEDVDTFWARRRITRPGDGWWILTEAEAEALLPGVPDAAELRALVHDAREQRGAAKDKALMALEEALVDPRSRRVAWERAGLLRRIQVAAEPVHPHTTAASASLPPHDVLVASQPGMALAWAARGLDAQRTGLAGAPEVLLDPSWQPVWEAIGRSGSRPERWISLLDGFDLPIDASRALVVLASAHPMLERFPRARLLSAWAESLLSTRLRSATEARLDHEAGMLRALARLSDRARALLPVFDEDPLDALLARVRPGVDVDPHKLLPTPDTAQDESFEEWWPGRAWTNRRSLAEALVEASPWQFPLVDVFSFRSMVPPTHARLEHGAQRGLAAAAEQLLWRAPVDVGARHLHLLPEARQQEAFLKWLGRVEPTDHALLLEVAVRIPGVARLVREAFWYGVTMVEIARRHGHSVTRFGRPKPHPDRLIIALASAIARATRDRATVRRMKRLLRAVIELPLTVEPGLREGVPTVAGSAAEYATLGRAVTSRLLAVDALRAEAAEALFALGDDAPLRARLDAGLSLGAGSLIALRRLHGWFRLLAQDPTALFRGHPTPPEVDTFLADAEAGSPPLADALARGRAYDARNPGVVPDPWWEVARWALPEKLQTAFELLDATRVPEDGRARRVRAVLVVLANGDYWPLGHSVPEVVWAWLLGHLGELDWVGDATRIAQGRAARVLAEASDAEVLDRWATGKDDAVYEGVNAVLDQPARWEQAASLAPRADRWYALLGRAAEHFISKDERLPEWLKREARAELPDYPGWLPFSRHPDIWPLVRAWLEATDDLSERVERAIHSVHPVQLHNELVADAVLSWVSEAPDPFAPGNEGLFGRLPATWSKALDHVSAWVATGLAPLDRLGPALARLWALAVKLPLGDDGLVLRRWAPAPIGLLAALLARCGRRDVLLATYRNPPTTTDEDRAVTSSSDLYGVRLGPWGEPKWCPLLGVSVDVVVDRGSLLRGWLFDRVWDLLEVDEQDWRTEDALQEWRAERAWAAGDAALIERVCERARTLHPRDRGAVFTWMRAAAARPEATLGEIRARWEATPEDAWVELVEEIDDIWGPWQSAARLWARRCRVGHERGAG